MRFSDVCLAYRWQFRLRRFYSPTGKATTVMKFLGEFKELINHGNVMDLAVAVIIGCTVFDVCTVEFCWVYFLFEARVFANVI